MPRIKKKKEKVFGPVSVIILLTLVICVLSFFVSVFGLESHKTLIANGTLESSLINVKNMLSMDGLKFFIQVVPMTQVTLLLEPTVAAFYKRVAQSAGLSLEQVLSDALFKLAAELSLEAMKKRS